MMNLEQGSQGGGLRTSIIWELVRNTHYQLPWPTPQNLLIREPPWVGSKNLLKSPEGDSDAC